MVNPYLALLMLMLPSLPREHIHNPILRSLSHTTELIGDTGITTLIPRG